MLDGLPFVCPWDFTICKRRSRFDPVSAERDPRFANQDLAYSTLWNPVSMVTLVPVTLPCT
jgi:hypothetical protein